MSLIRRLDGVPNECFNTLSVVLVVVVVVVVRKVKVVDTRVNTDDAGGGVVNGEDVDDDDDDNWDLTWIGEAVSVVARTVCSSDES